MSSSELQRVDRSNDLCLLELAESTNRKLVYHSEEMRRGIILHEFQLFFRLQHLVDKALDDKMEFLLSVPFVAMWDMELRCMLWEYQYGHTMIAEHTRRQELERTAIESLAFLHIDERQVQLQIQHDAYCWEWLFRLKVDSNDPFFLGAQNLFWEWEESAREEVSKAESRARRAVCTIFQMRRKGVLDYSAALMDEQAVLLAETRALEQERRQHNELPLDLPETQSTITFLAAQSQQQQTKGQMDVQASKKYKQLHERRILGIAQFRHIEKLARIDIEDEQLAVHKRYFGNIVFPQFLLVLSELHERRELGLVFIADWDLEIQQPFLMEIRQLRYNERKRFAMKPPTDDGGSKDPVPPPIQQPAPKRSLSSSTNSKLPHPPAPTQDLFHDLFPKPFLRTSTKRQKPVKELTDVVSVQPVVGLPLTPSCFLQVLQLQKAECASRDFLLDSYLFEMDVLRELVAVEQSGARASKVPSVGSTSVANALQLPPQRDPNPFRRIGVNVRQFFIAEHRKLIFFDPPDQKRGEEEAGSAEGKGLIDDPTLERRLSGTIETQNGAAVSQTRSPSAPQQEGIINADINLGALAATNKDGTLSWSAGSTRGNISDPSFVPTETAARREDDDAPLLECTAKILYSSALANAMKNSLEKFDQQYRRPAALMQGSKEASAMFEEST